MPIGVCVEASKRLYGKEMNLFTIGICRRLDGPTINVYIQLLKDQKDQIWLRLIPNGGIMAIQNRNMITKEYNEIEVSSVLAETEYSPRYVQVDFDDPKWVEEHLLTNDHKAYNINGQFAATMEAFKCKPEALAIWQKGWDGK